MTRVDDVVEVLRAGSRDDVTACLTGLTAQQRKAFGPTFRRWLSQGPTVRVRRDRQLLAVLATAGGIRQALLFTAYGWELTDDLLDDAVFMLAQRRPAWLPAFVEACLAEEGSWGWRTARRIVRAGLVAPPATPDYYRGTVRGVPDYDVRHHRTLLEQLDRDPELVGEHLVAMLSTELVGRLLAYHDGYVGEWLQKQRGDQPLEADTWRGAVLSLTAAGRLDRGRVLDTVLAAPLRDWAAADLGWYVGMHDALQPTVEEVVARQLTYARLLTVEHGPSVKLAQRQLARVLGDPRLDVGLVLGASKATLGRSDKSTVVAQLRLLEKLHTAHADIDITGTVRMAMDHPRADMREQAAKLLGTLGDDEPMAAETQEPFVAPSPQPWPTVASVEPIRSADELGELLLSLMEEIDAIQLERAIDGLLRFAEERPRISDLLARRADDVTYYLDDPRLISVTLTRAWLTPRRWFRDGDWTICVAHRTFPTRPAVPDTFIGAVGRRFTCIAEAVRRGASAAVALPSHADGSLDADLLTRRLTTLQRRQLPEMEVAVALLRVPPADRGAVILPPWLRRSPAVARVMASTPPSWQRELATHRDRSWKAARRIPLFRDVDAREGTSVDGVLGRRRPGRTLAAEYSYGEFDSRFEDTLTLGALLLPHEPDVLAAHAHPFVHRDLYKDRAVTVPVLDALARSHARHGAPAASALVLGLAAKDARARTAAQDALIDRARHGVLDGAAVGRQAALLLQEDVVVGQRLSSGLAEVARASEAALLTVLDVLQQLFPALTGRRDAGPFVDLAADAGERTGRKLELPPQLRDLAASSSTSALARAARRLI